MTLLFPCIPPMAPWPLWGSRSTAAVPRAISLSTVRWRSGPVHPFFEPDFDKGVKHDRAITPSTGRSCAAEHDGRHRTGRCVGQLPAGKPGCRGVEAGRRGDRFAYPLRDLLSIQPTHVRPALDGAVRAAQSGRGAHEVGPDQQRHGLGRGIDAGALHEHRVAQEAGARCRQVILCVEALAARAAFLRDLRTV